MNTNDQSASLILDKGHAAKSGSWDTFEKSIAAAAIKDGSTALCELMSVLQNTNAFLYEMRKKDSTYCVVCVNISEKEKSPFASITQDAVEALARRIKNGPSYCSECRYSIDVGNKDFVVCGRNGLFGHDVNKNFWCPEGEPETES